MPNSPALGENEVTHRGGPGHLAHQCLSPPVDIWMFVAGNTGNKSIVNKCSSRTKDGACDRDAWVTAVGWAGRLRHAPPVVLALLLSGHSKTGRWASAVSCEWHHRSHSPW